MGKWPPAAYVSLSLSWSPIRIIVHIKTVLKCETHHLVLFKEDKMAK